MDFATRTVHAPALGIEFEVLADDALIGPAIERGTWEEHETRLFQAHLRPGARVLDLGANIGWYGALAVLAGAEVHCFEPVPAIAEVCRRNLERAQRARRDGPGRATLHQVAAAERSGTARIVLARHNHGDNRVLDDGAAAPRDLADAESLEIELARVDERVAGPFRVIKVDTQGSEALALRGAERALAASPACALFVEFWPYALRGVEPLEFLRSLQRAGFTLGKASAAPYPMAPERILMQTARRDPVRGGIDLYGTRALPFHVLGPAARVRACVRSWREE